MVLADPARSSDHIALEALETSHGKVKAQSLWIEPHILDSEDDMHVGVVVGVVPCAT